jgi:hypothetical protein
LLFWPFKITSFANHYTAIRSQTQPIRLNTAIRNAKDNSWKQIMNEPDLFVEFLRDFVPIGLLKEVNPGDIEDMTERFLPLFQDNKDSEILNIPIETLRDAH